MNTYLHRGFNILKKILSFKKTFLVLATAYICLQLTYTLFDISTRKIDPAANPDFNATQPLDRPSVYLISFAAGNEVFFQNQNALAQSALNRGVDFILNYRRSHIDKDFYEKHKDILKEGYGAGYWLWKPYFILKTLNEAPEGSLIVYADSGVMFTGSLKPLLDLLKTHEGVFYKYKKVRQYSQHPIDPGVLHDVGLDHDQKFLTSHKLWAGFMAFRNCEAARNFVRRWLDLCTHAHLVKGYGALHEHDQSLLNVAFYQGHGTMIAPLYTYFRPFVTWPHRRPEKASTSLLFWQSPHLQYRIGRLFQNWIPFKWLCHVWVKGWY